MKPGSNNPTVYVGRNAAVVVGKKSLKICYGLAIQETGRSVSIITLKGRSGFTFKLRITDVRVDDEAPRASANLIFDYLDSQLLSIDCSLTRGDFEEMVSQLQKLVDGKINMASIMSSDFDLVLTAERGEYQPSDHITIGIWVGELYQWMRGFRFVVSSSDLSTYISDLRAAEVSLF